MANLARVINQHGYSIYINSFDSKDIDKVKKELLITPWTDKPEYGVMEPFKNYQMTKNRLYMPIRYGITRFGEPDQNLLYPGDDIDLDFKLTLHAYQKPIVKKTINFIKNQGGGVLSMYCGGGKTIMAIYIISVLKKKTLIFVHTQDLLEQWIERIKVATPNARVGIIRQSTTDIVDKDIVIAMIQSVSKRQYPHEIFHSFGFVIADEVHLMATKVFSRGFFKTVSKLSLGLSATPYRTDKCEEIFFQHLGPIIHYEKRPANNNLLVNMVIYKINGFRPEYDRSGNVSYVKTLIKVCNNESRTNFIVSETVKLVKSKRKVLILGEYVNHLKYINQTLTKALNDSNHPASCGLLIGELSKKDRLNARTFDVIIATYKLASVGMDIKDLSALILASPRKYGTQLEQSIGRILRENDPEMKPMIIDIIDKFYYFYYQGLGSKKGKGRIDFYKEYGYEIICQQTNNHGVTKIIVSEEEEENVKLSKCLIDI